MAEAVVLQDSTDGVHLNTYKLDFGLKQLNWLTFHFSEINDNFIFINSLNNQMLGK